jgi:UDP:flavonoid glycosyltransferase YjiC (YdhE family)
VLAPAPAFHHFRHLGALPHRLLLGFGNRLTSRWAEPLYAFRRELGLPRGENPVFAGKHSPSLTLALFPEFFASPQADWPAQVRQTGFPFFHQVIPDSTSHIIKRFLESGSPPIVFTLGSSMVEIADDFYAMAARSAAEIGRRAILLIGKNPPPAGLPDSILPLSYAPLEAVFPGAAAVVHHGGIGSCAMALRSGIPSLVIPFAYDQPDNAERLRKLGAGLTMPRSGVTSKSLTSKLSRILEDQHMRDRARELAANMAPEENMKQTIRALEQAMQPS